MRAAALAKVTRDRKIARQNRMEQEHRDNHAENAGTGVVGGITERGNDACGAVVSTTAPAAAALTHYGAPRTPVPLMAELSAPLPTTELPALVFH